MSSHGFLAMSRILRDSILYNRPAASNSGNPKRFPGKRHEFHFPVYSIDLMTKNTPARPNVAHKSLSMMSFRPTSAAWIDSATVKLEPRRTTVFRPP